MKSQPFYIIVFALFLFLAGKGLLSTGMFMDGLIYDCVARNMADGIGSMWHPVYTETYFHEFYEHPPLAMFLLSLCYRLAGMGLWVCRAYSLLMFAITALLIIRLWRYVDGDVRMGWLPLLFWIAVQSVSHFSYSNILEVSMAPFVVGSVLLVLRAYNARLVFLHGLLLLLSGVLLAAAFLTKGFTGLYPLVFPMILALMGYGADYKVRLFQRVWRAVIDTLMVIVGLAGSLGLLFLIDGDSYRYIVTYVETQVLGTINEPVVTSRFYIVRAFFERTAFVWLLFAVVAVIGIANKKQLLQTKRCKVVLAYCMLVAFGVLPVMVSLKQRSFYIFTVYPFFAVIMAVGISPVVESLLRRTSRLFRFVMPLVALLLLGAACGYQSTLYGKPDRDVVIQQDEQLILPYLQEGERVAIAKGMEDIYSLHGYYYRDRRVSLDCDDSLNLCQHLILNDPSRLDEVCRHASYEKVNIPTQEYHLYNRVEVKKPVVADTVSVSINNENE